MDLILKGTKLPNLPVELPTKVEFLINLQVAKKMCNDCRIFVRGYRSLFPGNGFLPAETNAPEWPLRIRSAFAGDKSLTRNAATSRSNTAGQMLEANPWRTLLRSSCS